MSRGVKITLVVVAVLLVLCCVGGAAAFWIGGRLIGQAAQQAFVEDPEQAAKIGHQIADYTLPPGYREVGAMNAILFKMVFIGPQSRSSDRMVFALMQYPIGSNVDQEEMQRQMRRAFEQQGQRRNMQMQVVGTRQVTIKGQPVTLVISEGSSSEGQTMRQVWGMFPGKDGTAMLMAMGDQDGWDQAALDKFLASIK